MGPIQISSCLKQTSVPRVPQLLPRIPTPQPHLLNRGLGNSTQPPAFLSHTCSYPRQGLTDLMTVCLSVPIQP